MAIQDVGNQVPAYAVWFASSGVLATLTGILAGRDGAVKEASEGEYELRLARLNNHLSTVARVAHTIVVGEAITYTVIRDRGDFEKLRRLVADVRRARLLTGVTKFLTGAALLAVALHFAAGVAVTSLSLRDVVVSDASDMANVALWTAITSVVVAMLVGKAIIYLVRSD
jgi:hypothetical protein